MLENNEARKKILRILTKMGTMMAFYHSYCLFTYNVKAEVGSFHIHYQIDFPLSFSWMSALFYFMPTVVSNFISSNKRISILGLSIAISYLFTILFFRDYVISVWCFFAAIQSAIVLYIITKMNQHFALKLRAV